MKEKDAGRRPAEEKTAKEKAEVKRDRKVGLAYMKSHEIKREMLEEGRKEGQREERARAEAEIARLKVGYERERGA